MRRCWNIRPRTSDTKIILRAFCRGKTSLPNLPSKSSRVTVPSTYSHQCFPSVETGISQLDHLQARWIQTQATTGGVYCRLKVVRCRLTSPGEKTKSHQLPRLSCRSTRDTEGMWGYGPLDLPRTTLGHRQLHPAPAQRGFGTASIVLAWFAMRNLGSPPPVFAHPSFCTGNLAASLREKVTGDLPAPPVL